MTDNLDDLDLGQWTGSNKTDLVFPVGKYAGMRVVEMPQGALLWFIGKYERGEFTPGALTWFFDQHLQDVKDILQGQKFQLVTEDEVDYTLNPSQQDTADGIVGLLLNKATNFFRLEGGAGYGKSFVIRDIVRRVILEKAYDVKAIAVSYVATEILRNQLDRYAIECATVARAMGLVKIQDGAEEEYVMGPNTENALHTLFTGNGNPVLLVIDEYSMVNDRHAVALGKAARDFGGAILAVGDLKQLPPVKQNTDSRFSGIPTAYTLTQPMRYSKESDLFKVEQCVRNDIGNLDALLWDLATNSDRNEVFLYTSRGGWMMHFQDRCQTFPHEDNRMLHFRRQDVIETNNAVRQRMFGLQAKPLEVGERLIVVRTSDYNDTRYYSGTTLDAVSVAIENNNLEAELTNGDHVKLLFAINESRADERVPGGAEYNVKLKDLAAQANEDEDNGVARSEAWRPYHDFRNEYIFVAYAYATTVHRSQGATVDRTFVAHKQLLSVPGIGHNLTYVAMTRARKELHVLMEVE